MILKLTEKKNLETIETLSNISTYVSVSGTSVKAEGIM